MTKYESFFSGLMHNETYLVDFCGSRCHTAGPELFDYFKEGSLHPRHIPRTSNAVEFISGQATISCARRHDFLHFYADIFDTVQFIQSVKSS